LPPRCLKLEITETTLMANLETASANIALLGQLGVGLSIDDFGTGYSSLSYLRRFPLQVLKVDRSFVRDIVSDPRSAEIAQTIVMLAHNLGLEAVAEGIETHEQLLKLQAIGCVFGQGFFFSRPVAPDAAIDFIGAFLPAPRLESTSDERDARASGAIAELQRDENGDAEHLSPW
jgi:EAL domain-containing protein (putative c-di-GMP-specific phosphodiesterase class I)